MTLMSMFRVPTYFTSVVIISSIHDSWFDFFAVRYNSNITQIIITVRWQADDTWNSSSLPHSGWCSAACDGNLSKSAFFEGGWVTMSGSFKQKGTSPTNHCGCQKTRVIILSCGIKICAVHCLVLSQSMRVTDRQTDGQNYDSQDCDSTAVSCSKNCIFWVSAGTFHLTHTEPNAISFAQISGTSGEHRSWWTVYCRFQKHGVNQFADMSLKCGHMTKEKLRWLYHSNSLPTLYSV